MLDTQVADFKRDGEKKINNKLPRRTGDGTQQNAEAKKLQKDIKAFLISILALGFPLHEIDHLYRFPWIKMINSKLFISGFVTRARKQGKWLANFCLWVSHTKRPIFNWKACQTNYFDSKTNFHFSPFLGSFNRICIWKAMMESLKKHHKVFRKLAEQKLSLALYFIHSRTATFLKWPPNPTCHGHTSQDGRRFLSEEEDRGHLCFEKW